MGIKKYIIGAIVGGVIGLWCGINIGKDKPIWSNPITNEERRIADKAKSKAQELMNDAKKALRETLEE
ncbi:MAG: hypothetical protein GXP08_10150 [Gammaproteobacteria bacterium]|nr:hypothetical protein [Gammaproteobacteria bacterium]